MSSRPGLLITRPAASTQAFVQDVRARVGSDIDIVIAPILTISYVSQMPDLDHYPTLIFTSAHAVRALAKMTDRRDFSCYAVGGATTDCAIKQGFDTKDGGGTATALAEQIIGDQPRTPCLYLRGKHIAYDLVSKLNSAGIETGESVMYDQQETELTPEALRLLSSGRPVLLPLFSARSAALFFNRYAANGPLDVVAMSENIARDVSVGRVRHLRVCENPTAEAMASEVALLLRDTNQLEGRPSPK